MTDDIAIGADGLPAVQPTHERVDAFLEQINRSATDTIGPFPLSERPASVETLAANAVMAGCDPAYFPVVLAALEASLAEEFNLYGLLATTEPHWPILIVNGPVTSELDINAGANAYGQSTRANATIGRALVLTFMNVADAHPGVTDMATHGGPHKFGVCVAENEEASPWSPLHVDRGFEPTESTVTVLGTEAPHNINDHVADSPQGVLTTAAHTMAKTGTNLAYLNERGEPHLVLSPEHAETIARAGWTKTDVQRFLYDHARIPRHLHRDHGMHDQADGGLPKHAQGLEDEQLVPLAATAEKFLVTVTGGIGRHSLFHPSFGDTESVTISIEDAT
ncbi:hypothetical protein [Haladaptatus halobius]|uniref:hypothetical protein n=1 Tax=Haladaptatus halobius TaxID=2884875 RepID=UPI001D0B9DC7|nr:hypothetical protein [Haladaptatus halobius]